MSRNRGRVVVVVVAASCVTTVVLAALLLSAGAGIPSETVVPIAIALLLALRVQHRRSTNT